MYLKYNRSHHQELPFVDHFIPICVEHVEGDPESCVRLWNKGIKCKS